MHTSFNDSAPSLTTWQVFLGSLSLVSLLARCVYYIELASKRLYRYIKFGTVAGCLFLCGTLFL